MKSQELIQQLLKAEKEADFVIQKARDNRVAKLKDAKTSADAELDAFKRQEEDKFQKEYSGAAGNKDYGGDLAKVTAQELQMVKQDYANNKDKCIEYILGKVLEVPLELNAAKAGDIKRGAL